MPTPDLGGGTGYQKPLLRSIIDFGDITPENLQHNYQRLTASGLLWDREDDAQIYAWVSRYYGANFEPPTIGILREAFPDNGESETLLVVERLKDLTAAPFYIRTNFAHALAVSLDAQRHVRIYGSLKKAHEILTKGIEDGRGRDARVLKGGDDALAFLEAEVARFKREGAKSAASTYEAIVDQWQADGRVIHEPTGFGPLDRLTGGGPVYPTRWFLCGAPDAGKTLLLLHLADVWARRGVTVGILAVDESASDVTTRAAQRLGISRQACEERSPETLARIREALKELPIRIYGRECTVEQAADNLAKFAISRGSPRAVLVADSVQTITCKAIVEAKRELGERQVVTLNAHALDDASVRHKMIVLTTSEMPRQFYGSKKGKKDSDHMAAGKESGAIEYIARVQLTLTTPEDHGDLIQVRVAKNKHGPRWPAAQDFHLALDRATQVLADATSPDESTTADPGFIQRCSRVLQYVVDHPDLTEKRLCRGTKLGPARVGACLQHLLDTEHVEEHEIMAKNNRTATVYRHIEHSYEPPTGRPSLGIEDMNGASAVAERILQESAL